MDGTEPAKPKRGGPRPGSGRKRTKVAKQLLSNVLLADLEKIAREDLVPAIRELVAGVQIMQYNKDGGARIYSQPPNATMAIYLADRILGKMPSRTEVTGGTDDNGDEKPIPIKLLGP
jgi:hypothetical protein